MKDDERTSDPMRFAEVILDPTIEPTLDKKTFQKLKDEDKVFTLLLYHQIIFYLLHIVGLPL
jgi:hypothetical protein